MLWAQGANRSKRCGAGAGLAVLMPVAALALVLSGCGSSSSSGGDASDWVGNWMEGGTQSTTCGAVSGTTQLSGLVVFSTGTKAGTIQTLANDCTLVWDVSGNKATLESGQACTVSIDGANATVGWTASSLMLTGSTTMTGIAGGAATNGCSFTQEITMTKM
jgi:hypothetical protein